MKYIVIGLGHFGSKLASHLTNMGHEVIGIDSHYDRLDELKDLITTVMKLDPFRWMILTLLLLQ
jgi:trk system potassium uptake protein TrkA